MLQELITGACKNRVTIGPAVDSLLSTFKIDPPWNALRSILEDQCATAVNGVLEVEELGLPFVESMIMQKDEHRQWLSTWKKTQKVSKLVYVCRALSETKGNVAEAARQSGLGRNAIYDVLREHEIELDRFRVKQQWTLFDEHHGSE